MNLPPSVDKPDDQPGMALFSAVFHQSPLAISLTRVEDGLLVDVNEAWVSLTGHSRDEVIGKSTIALGLWGDAARRHEALAPMRETGAPVSIESTMVTKGGGHRVVAFNASHFLLHGKPHLLAQIRDITGQQDSSKALKDRLTFIEKITNRVPGVVYQFRMRGDLTSHFPFATGALRDLFGLNPADVIEDATPAFMRVNPEDLAAVRLAVMDSAQNLTPWRSEFRITLDDGKERWMYGDSLPERQEDGSVIWHGFISDITERKRAQDDLQQARELAARKAENLTIALDNMSQGIVAMDVDANVTLYNQRFLEFLELPESLMVDGINGATLVNFQNQRGDFGPDLEWVEPHARAALASPVVNKGPDRYLRKTRTGITLEIKTKPLPGGGVVRTYADVTHFVDAQAALHESETRFRSLTELSSDWYWEQDENLRFVRIDGNVLVGSDIPSDSYIGKTRWEADNYGLTEAQWAEHRHALENHQTFKNFEMRRSTGAGRVLWASISGMPIFDAEGAFKGYRGIGRDISEQKRNEDESQRLAFYDTLTGLPNRRLLLNRLAQGLVTSARSHQQGALLFIDLDNFKDLNDTLGHDVGDQLLEKVANRLVTCIRQGDTVSRFGGDEFVVMLENLSADVQGAVAQVTVVGEKILSSMNMPFELADKLHYSTPSLGIAMFSGQNLSVDELLKRADLAMYQAKAAGRNTFRFFDPEMQAAVALRSALEVDLRHGLEREELMLYYQAVVDQYGHVTGVEALVRWHHPVRGMVSPADFIPMAEQTGLILPLGHWVLKTACAQLLAWSHDAQTYDMTIAVNISAREFRQPEFVAQTLEALRQTGANPSLLKLELTESLLLTDVQDAIKKMDELRAVGVSFSLDDFGTGYSSLSYLKRLPLDQLKIDQSFVRDVLTDPNDAAIAKTVVALAHSLGLSVVAEGVETEGQRDFLLSHGCQAFQGYLFGRPVPVEQLKLDTIDFGFALTQPNTF